MTAVLGDGNGVVTVICDGCGRSAQATDVLRDEDLVWPSISLLGWTGSPFATGAHWCPGCGFTSRAVSAAVTAQALPVSAGDVCDVRDDAGTRARVVVLRADLDQRVTDEVRTALVEATAAGRNVVIDMHNAGVIDSAGLGLLVRAHRDAKHRGAAVHLVAPSRFVVAVLHTMHLDTVFPIYPDQRAALSALGSLGSLGGRNSAGPRAYHARIPA
jgi:anti-sigma B factor antagonist